MESDIPTRSFSLKSWLEHHLLQQNDPILIWLVRLVATVVIAVAWHLYTRDPSRSALPRGKTLAGSSAVDREEEEDGDDDEQEETLLYDELEQDEVASPKGKQSIAKEDSHEQDFVVVENPSIDACTQTYPSVRREDRKKKETPEEANVAASPETEDACTQTYPSARLVADHERNVAIEKNDDETKGGNEPKRAEEDDQYDDTDKDEAVEFAVGESSASQTTLQPSTASIRQHTPIKATSDTHPGLDAFYYWYNVETSLYRIYELGRRDGTPVICPFLPKSERGHVKIHLQVTNQLLVPIEVFWVDYHGQEKSRGVIHPGGMWRQITWIGHPWTFRPKGEGQDVLLHYIPYRVIPTTRQVPTISAEDPDIGVHQLNILPHIPGTPYTCRVVDPVLPHPPQYSLDTPIKAAKWTLQHMERTAYFNYHMLNLDSPLLLKYLTNIVAHPDQTKYRQIRIAQPKFAAAVWNTAARGLLLACGFVEEQAYAELGTEERLSSDRVSDVSLLLMTLEQWKSYQERENSQTRQPEGADGFGRANFGRAGAMGL